MKKQTLHELAKFAAGLIAADFIGLVWLSMNNPGAGTFLGIDFASTALLPALVFDAALFIILVHYGWHVGKTPLMRERTYLLAVGIVFAIVAAAHLLRVFTGTDIVVLGWSVPLLLSWIGTAVTAYLSYMSFHLALRMR